MRAALRHPPALGRQSDPVEGAPLVALEGFHLVSEAFSSGLVPAAIFLRQGEDVEAMHTLTGMMERPDHGIEAGVSGDRLASGVDVLVLPPALFNSMLGTKSPQALAALVVLPSPTPASLFDKPLPLVLVLAGLQDPGNVGTLLRSAEAFGGSGALLLPGTASPWNAKSLRASAGSSLRLPLLNLSDAEEAAAMLRKHRVRSFAAVARDGDSMEDAPLYEAAALWIGNEGSGLTEREMACCERQLTLPMVREVESVNAAIAGSLLLYEASRQRARRAS